MSGFFIDPSRPNIDCARRTPKDVRAGRRLDAGEGKHECFMIDLRTWLRPGEPLKCAERIHAVFTNRGSLEWGM